MSLTTRKMSDAHEAHIAAVLTGRVTRGSGNQSFDQMDVRQHPDTGQYVFAADGKSTLALSVGLTRAMWEKAKEQARNAIPVIPIRFYANNRLTAIDADLAVLDLDTLGALQADANRLYRIQEQGCLVGIHEFTGERSDICVVCGANTYHIERARD